MAERNDSIKKDYETIELKSSKLKIAVVLYVIVGVSVLIRLTPLIRSYWLNYLTALVAANGFGLVFIASLLVAIHIVEIRRFKELLAKEDEEHVN